MGRALVIRCGLEVNIYPVGDVHVGSRACDEARCARLADIIASDPSGHIIGLGDYIEAIAPDDRRWSPRELPDDVRPEMLENITYAQTMRFCRVFERTAGRWLALVRGNHEQTAINRQFFDPCAVIAERVGCAYIGEYNQSGWIRLLLTDGNGKTRASVNLYVAHGWAGGELKGGVALALQRVMLRKPAADVILLAHSHQPLAFPETVEQLDRAGRVVTRTRWGVITFPLITMHGYIARRGGNPAPAGYSVVHIASSRRDFVTISVEQKTI